MSISKGEQCKLLDNSEKTKWSVRTSSAQDAVIPAVCFVIPPPDQDTVEFAKT